MHMDKKLTWREHIVKKRKQIDLKFKQLYWLLGRKSPLSLENKVLVYKVAIKPVRTYWHRTMGLRQQLQYCHPTKIPNQDTPING
jgi:hypothetical protein